MKQAIQIGQAAPDCALPDDAGQTVTLSALWRGKPLLLVFLRHFG